MSPFPSSTCVPKVRLKSVHYDLWTFLVASLNGYKYMLSLSMITIDFLGFIPCSEKYISFLVTSKFNCIVENFLSNKIKSFQMDGSKEFLFNNF